MTKFTLVLYVGFMQTKKSMFYGNTLIEVAHNFFLTKWKLTSLKLFSIVSQTRKILALFCNQNRRSKQELFSKDG